MAGICTLVVLACAPAAPAKPAPASRFNGPGQGHHDVCVRLAQPLAALRFGNGDRTGFDLSRDLSFEKGRCGPGVVRIDLHETIPSSLGPLVFHRGGHGYDDAQNVKYGQLLESDLASPMPRPLPSGGGRGSACRLSDERPYRLRVRSIPQLMKYKRPQETDSGSNSGASFLHYGDPGSDQGDRHDIHYTYLSWSWLNVQGGGMVRTLLPHGQVVRACDVEPITMKSWDKQGRHNGYVAARYVRTVVGSCPIYGWIAWAYLYFGDDAPQVQHHANPVLAPPRADPKPSDSCPRSPAARPPEPRMDAATLEPGGELKMRGRINPEGVPAFYRFELGRTRSYGRSTARHELHSDERIHHVYGRIGGLSPGTVYHYRLVVSSVHGTSRTRDFTIRTPGDMRAAPRPPRPRPRPPRPRPGSRGKRPVTLSDLRVSPRRFRRTDSLLRAKARIRYHLSRRAKVTFSFHRRVRGRWVPVRAAARLPSPSGDMAVPFAGWIGTHKLRRGRYRLTMVPRVPEGRGTARRARFRLR